MQPHRTTKSPTVGKVLLAALFLGVFAVVLLIRRAPQSTPSTPTVSSSPSIANSVAPAEEPPIPAVQARMPPAHVDASSVSTTASDEATLAWIKEILQALASPDKTTRDNALNSLLPALVQKDPSAAGVLAEANTAAGTREEVMRRVAQLWAAQDKAGALAWAAALSKPEERDATISDVCLQIAQTNPAEAVQIRDRYAPPDHVDHPDSTLVNLTQQWAEKDWSAALQWASSRGAGEEHNQIISRLAFVQSETSPANAARLLLNHLTPGPAQFEAITSIVQRWAEREPSAAGAWVNQLPVGPLRDQVSQEVNRISSLQPSR